jgi:hypothetical protein
MHATASFSIVENVFSFHTAKETLRNLASTATYDYEYLASSAAEVVIKEKAWARRVQDKEQADRIARRGDAAPPAASQQQQHQPSSSKSTSIEAWFHLPASEFEKKASDLL